MCVFALSSVIGMVVTSVYPETFQQQTKYSQFQNETIFPWVAHHSLLSKLVHETKLIFMWTTHGIHVHPGISKNFQPNHFVPLVEYMGKDQGKKSHQKKITDSFRIETVQKAKLTSEDGPHMVLKLELQK